MAKKTVEMFAAAVCDSDGVQMFEHPELRGQLYRYRVLAANPTPNGKSKGDLIAKGSFYADSDADALPKAWRIASQTYGGDIDVKVERADGSRLVLSAAEAATTLGAMAEPKVEMAFPGYDNPSPGFRQFRKDVLEALQDGVGNDVMAATIFHRHEARMRDAYRVHEPPEQVAADILEAEGFDVDLAATERPVALGAGDFDMVILTSSNLANKAAQMLDDAYSNAGDSTKVRPLSLQYLAEARDKAFSAAKSLRMDAAPARFSSPAVPALFADVGQQERVQRQEKETEAVEETEPTEMCNTAHPKKDAKMAAAETLAAMATPASEPVELT